MRGKPSSSAPVLLLRLQEFAQQDADHFPVSDHATARFDGPCFRRIEELGNDDGRGVDAAHLADEIRVGSFARPRSASEQDQLFGKAQLAASEFLLHFPPDGTEDELRIFDFQVDGCGLGGWRGLGWVHGRNPSSQKVNTFARAKPAQ